MINWAMINWTLLYAASSVMCLVLAVLVLAAFICLRRLQP